MSTNAPSTPDPLHLEGPLTVATVAEAFPRVREVLRAGPAGSLDLSGITQVDGAGLQLLMLAAREARAAGGTLALHAPSRAVRAALAIARLGDDLLPEPLA